MEKPEKTQVTDVATLKQILSEQPDTNDETALATYFDQFEIPLELWEQVDGELNEEVWTMISQRIRVGVCHNCPIVLNNLPPNTDGYDDDCDGDVDKFYRSAA